MDPFLGEVRMFGGSFAPVGWLFCNGQLLPMAVYPDLYTLLGTTYGGDGITTFAVPDLRGRTPIHFGNGAGLTPRIQGQTFGSESMPLTSAHLPAHSHQVNASSAPGNTADPAGALWAVGSTGEKQYTQNTSNVTMAANSMSIAGSGQPHENMAPFLAVSFIIATDGTYPMRS